MDYRGTGGRRPISNDLLAGTVTRLRTIVRSIWAERGEDPDCDPAAANIDYNSTDCRRRAAILLAHVERAYGFSLRGKTVCELGAGFGGLCLHFALERGARHVLAVDRAPDHVAALQTIVREFGLDGFTIVEADLQTFPGYDGTVDLVVLNDVLYTAALAPDRVAAVCARLLRRDGIVLFRQVNRAHGAEVASHRDGTQFLDPDSADRAARLLGGDAGSTLAHRPLSPSGLAAFLRQAGFEDLRLDGDNDGRRDMSQASQGLRPRYLLCGRKGWAGGWPLHRIAPPPDGVLDISRFRDAVAGEDPAVRVAARALRGVFGTALSEAAACIELRGYLVDRLLMDGLSTFRADPADIAARGFADAIETALDHALAAELSRHAGWTMADFASAAPARLTPLLERPLALLRRRFRPPHDRRWAEIADWAALAVRVIGIVAPGKTVDRRGRDRIGRQLRALVGDHLRLGAVRLLARCADPLTGSVAEEYAEAAIDHLSGKVRDIVEPAAAGPRPACPPDLVAFVEAVEADIARGDRALTGAR